jgi:hypothetical protein
MKIQIVYYASDVKEGFDNDATIKTYNVDINKDLEKIAIINILHRMIKEGWKIYNITI